MPRRTHPHFQSGIADGRVELESTRAIRSNELEYIKRSPFEVDVAMMNLAEHFCEGSPRARIYPDRGAAFLFNS
jgi:hypothetical protein